MSHLGGCAAVAAERRALGVADESVLHRILKDSLQGLMQSDLRHRLQRVESDAVDDVDHAGAAAARSVTAGRAGASSGRPRCIATLPAANCAPARRLALPKVQAELAALL